MIGELEEVPEKFMFVHLSMEKKCRKEPVSLRSVNNLKLQNSMRTKKESVMN